MISPDVILEDRLSSAPATRLQHERRVRAQLRVRHAQRLGGRVAALGRHGGGHDGRVRLEAAAGELKRGAIALDGLRGVSSTRVKENASSTRVEETFLDGG